MPRRNGSYFGLTVNPTPSVASGIWRVREAEEFLRVNRWPATPGVPGSPVGIAGDGQVSLTWSAPTLGTPPTDYQVQYSSNSGSTWTTFADGTSTATSAVVTGLTNGTGYIFRVRAVNALGEGPYGSASGVVTPSGHVAFEIAGLSLLLRADAGITQSGGIVTAWADQSGNEKHAAGVGGSSDPSFVASAVNGLPAVSFDGVDDRMQGGSLITSLPCTIFVVAKFKGDTAIGALFSQTNSELVFYRGTQASDIFRIYNGIDLSATGAPQNEEWSIVCAIADGSNSLIAKNGQVIATGNSGSQTPSGNYLVGWWDGGIGANAEIAEVIVFNRALTVAEIGVVDQFLNLRYSIYTP